MSGPKDSKKKVAKKKPIKKGKVYTKKEAIIKVGGIKLKKNKDSEQDFEEADIKEYVWTGKIPTRKEILQQFGLPPGLQDNAIHSEQQEQENRRKYGQLDDDTIARAYRHSKQTGDVYCAFTAEKYITRFISNSAKSGNTLDLKKSIDYIRRIILMNEEKKEIIEK